MNKWKIEAVIIALGMIIGGKFIGDGVKSMANKDRTIQVRGLAEREVKADKVTWNIGFSITGNELAAAYDNLNKKEQAVTKFLSDNGIRTQDIYHNAPNVYDSQTDRYSTQKKADRYTISSSVTVSTKDVDAVSALYNRQGDLLKEGVAVDSYYADYEFTGLNDIKPAMIEEATKAAREAAEKFAKDSDSDLGKIRNARQGQFSISDRDSYTPYIKLVRVVTYVDYAIDD